MISVLQDGLKDWENNWQLISSNLTLGAIFYLVNSKDSDRYSFKAHFVDIQDLYQMTENTSGLFREG